MTDLSLENAAKGLRQRRAQFAEAEQVYKDASRARTAALNVLNDAQKAFDAAVLREKEKPPFDSNWGQAIADRRAAV